MQSRGVDGDRRLIEDYLPIDTISGEARDEGSVTQSRGYLSKGLLSLVHQWWARRPLAACRPAIYGALVSANREDRLSASRFVERLAHREVSGGDLLEAALRIRESHGGAAPRVLDPFAGGGSIALEASRMGCESHAFELNPVAHLVELATLVFPGQYGQQLSDEVRRWAQIVFEKARADLGDLYPPVPDRGGAEGRYEQADFEGRAEPSKEVTPLAYLWTRAVPCRQCGRGVPLHRQTWLRRKSGAFVALRPVPDSASGHIRYEVLTSKASRQRRDEAEKAAVAEWGFNPSDLSKGGEAECLFCRAVATTAHVKESARKGNMTEFPMAVVTSASTGRGKSYFAAESTMLPAAEEIAARLAKLSADFGLAVPDEPLRLWSGVINPPLYGLDQIGKLFTARQSATLLTLVKHVRIAHGEMLSGGMDQGLARAVATYLAFIVDKVAERGSAICSWDNTSEKVQRPVGGGRMPMVWDFPEVNPFAGGSGSWAQSAKDILGALDALCAARIPPCSVERGSALSLPYEDGSFDAVITDPPYYFNVPYSYLADFFYAWLKRSVGHLYPEHFAGAASPTRAEIIMDPPRYAGNREQARQAYESLMTGALEEINRVLKPGCPLVCVYAHTTTAGWATLVDSLRRSGFAVTEAWPIDTETPSRQRSQGSAALASSIFIVARKRDGQSVGAYETEVRPELEGIVRERVATLWDMGISGADLVIAAVGAGLRAFTRLGSVEYANGEPVPTERFLAEVEGVVLEVLLEKIFGVRGAGVSSVDGPSRFYVLWRFAYGSAELDAGEAIVFTYSQPVELDGAHGLSSGTRAMIQKKKSSYRLLDFTERLVDEKLGAPTAAGTAAPLIDVLHRILWLLEHNPGSLRQFLDESRPDADHLRLLAQTVSGAGLRGGSSDNGRPLIATTTAEQAALAKLLANWRALIEQQLSAHSRVAEHGPLFAASAPGDDP